MGDLARRAREGDVPGFVRQLKKTVRRLRYTRQIFKSLDGVHPRECNICGYSGMFGAQGLPPRFDAKCPSCGSLERHRHQALWISQNEAELRGKRILHFAPEPILREIYRGLAGNYLSADIKAACADRILNLEKIDLPDASWDVIIANHVLEHVDDKKALAEIHRVLAPGGLAILSFPLALAFERTYEDPTITSKAGRDLHFGQWDHVRYYGADAAERIAAAGFAVSTISASEPYVHRHAIARQSRDFLARKREASGS